MGIPEYEAKRYEGRVKDGGILVSVHGDSSEEVSRAKDVLKRVGGEDVASAGEKSVSTHTTDGRDVDTVNAYRSREPRYEPAASTEDKIVDEEIRADRLRRAG